MSQYKSIEELLDAAKKANGHRISDFNVNNRSLTKDSKGSIGQIVEEGVFGYPINSRAEADFNDLGVELKVTGLKKLKNNDYVTKERLVLNIVNYLDEYKTDFENSSFWKKNKNLLIMFYLYDFDKKDNDFYVIDSILHQFSKTDLEIVKKDWQDIVDKIKAGKADEISESDTMYLGCCTKGANANSLRKQPFSDKLAKQRAFCLKSSYMNSVIKNYFLKEKCEHIATYEELKQDSLEYIISSKFNKYIGRSEEDLFRQFNVPLDAKSKFNILSSRILGIKGNPNNTDEFQKASIELKTIRIEENNRIKESMSFPCFKFKEIVNQEWEESDLYNIFSTKKFFFIVFKKINGVYYLEKVKFWNMPALILNNEVKATWEETKKVIKEGDIVKEFKSNKYITNFPGSSFNGICHVRPHDIKSIENNPNGGFDLPVPDNYTGLTRYTKQCFWLDRNYILSIINDQE